MPITWVGSSTSIAHHRHPKNARWFQGGARMLTISDDERMAILNTADKSAPVILGSTHNFAALDGYYNKIGLNDAETIAYVYAGSPARVSCWDITGSAPVLLGSLVIAQLTQSVNTMARYGNRLYFGDTGSGSAPNYKVVDVSSPSAPFLAASFALGTGTGQVNGCAVVGSKLIGTRMEQPRKYDVSELAGNPLAPTHLGAVAWEVGTTASDPFPTDADELGMARGGDASNSPSLVHSVVGSPGSIIGRTQDGDLQTGMGAHGTDKVVTRNRQARLKVWSWTTGNPVELESLATGLGTDNIDHIDVAAGHVAVAAGRDFGIGESNTVHIYRLTLEIINGPFANGWLPLGT